MRFRPCIDIHNGLVKQIVGGSLKDELDSAKDNFIASHNADFYADMYKKDNLLGGHIIILNPKESEFYEADVAQAKLALERFPGGFQIGGGMNPSNAEAFLQMGASHIIVTSYIFNNGDLNMKNLKNISELVTPDKLVIDLSCRKKDGKYFIVTDRWQNFTNLEINDATMDMLSKYCAEYLVHAVDVEGKANGIERDLVEILGKWGKKPMTYAGGIANLEDIQTIKALGNGMIDFTVGSSLDIYGGDIKYEDIVK